MCGKVSYCSKECQAHKPSCPRFILRESPSKGRGLFATRKIKEGQVILEEYPIITINEALSYDDFQDNLYPFIIHG